MLSKVELRGLPMPQKKKPKPRESKGFGILDGVVPVTATHNAEPTSVNKQEHDALFAAASEIRNQYRRDYIVEDEPQVLVDSKRQKGRGKGQNKRGQRKNAQNSGNKVDDANNKVAASDKPEISSSEHKGQTADNDSAVTDVPSNPKSSTTSKPTTTTPLKTTKSLKSPPSSPPITACPFTPPVKFVSLLQEFSSLTF